MLHILHLSHPPCHCVTCSGLDISSLPRPAESGSGDIPHTRHNSRHHRGGKNMFIADMEAMFDAGLISTGSGFVIASQRISLTGASLLNN